MKTNIKIFLEEKVFKTIVNLENKTTNVKILSSPLIVKASLVNKEGLPGKNGLSAYQLALQEGFIGTLQDWLNSLVSSGGTVVKEIIKTSGETISTGMAVILKPDGKIYKFNINDSTHYGLFVGISKTSATLNNQITISLIGSVLTDVGSGWSVGNNYYIGNNSLLSITPPSSGISKKVGTGIGTDEIYINDYNEVIKL